MFKLGFAFLSVVFFACKCNCYANSLAENPEGTAKELETLELSDKDDDVFAEDGDDEPEELQDESDEYEDGFEPKEG